MNITVLKGNFREECERMAQPSESPIRTQYRSDKVPVWKRRFVSYPQHAFVHDDANRLMTGVTGSNIIVDRLCKCPRLLRDQSVVWPLDLIHPALQWQGSLLLTTVQRLWHRWTSVSETLLQGVELVIQLSAASPAMSQCPSNPSQVLRFKPLDGFKVHRERDTLQDCSRVGRHIRIQSNASGLLRVSKKAYTTPKVHKGNHAPTPAVPVLSGFNPVVIPDCIDHLPDCVDLSTLNNTEPRPRLTSVSGSGLRSLSGSKV
ncbi:hypothetical protein JVT61DRAFT_11598 [Boletus reticuloceps]|uniref:Uncharacterized protein n=1 Tax=Boletus reticuloceps TaxID=495285 RepID=A0A8I2YCT2_9AGAM|nr:hypothetical protein JVT61DRAFT_14287 [Boletus reticuloceps]KAG6379158.1 hypothetical protein JVT61DRAFT_11598 [Boletus reticuloceps]